MNLNQVYEACQKCGEFRKPKQYEIPNVAIYGNLESKTILIGSLSDFIYFIYYCDFDELSKSNLFQEVGITFSTRCIFDSINQAIENKSDLHCLFFTRVISYSFKNFFMTLEVAKQLGVLKDEHDEKCNSATAKDPVIFDTIIGRVNIIDSIEPFLSGKLQLDINLDKECEKIMRKEIILE